MDVENRGKSPYHSAKKSSGVLYGVLQGLSHRGAKEHHTYHSKTNDAVPKVETRYSHV